MLPKQLRARSSEVRVSFTVSISARPTSAASLTWLLARESSVRQPFDLSASASATVPAPATLLWLRVSLVSELLGPRAWDEGEGEGE